MREIPFSPLPGRSAEYYTLLGWFALMVAGGLGGAWYMEHHGHWVTGMSNEIVWGTPHVFAVFLIVAASGALNVASIASVFGRVHYKPLSPLSALVSLALLAGGLAVLVLDLGRPDRLIVAMTTYNFKSIFAWNIYLYTGFFVVVGIYIWMMMEWRMNKYKSPVGVFAFLWRLTLTTGTGSIFGFLVARQAYDAAIMAPMFIILSFTYGIAIFYLVVVSTYTWSERPLGDFVIRRMRNMLRIFVAAGLYFVIVFNLTNLYATEHHGVVRFILLDGGVYTTLFWVVQVFLGGIVPLVILFQPGLGHNRQAIGLAAALVLVGGVCQMYVTIIGGQAYPLVLFPGMDVSSSFFDGVVASYTPSLPELLLGLGGIGLALLIVTLAVKLLPFLPDSLADADMDRRFHPDEHAAHFDEDDEEEEPQPATKAA